MAGADANEHAVKFARQARELPHGWIITRDRSYHGASYACMAFSETHGPVTRLIRSVTPLRKCVPYAYRCPFGSSNEIELRRACGRGYLLMKSTAEVQSRLPQS